MMEPRLRTPWWMTLVIIIAVLPVALWPTVISAMPEGTFPTFMLYLYPAYVIAAGICAYISYPQRPEVAWILVGLLVLSHLGIAALIFA